MKQALGLLLAQVFVSVAMAMPSVGDLAVFAGKLEGSAGGEIEFEQSLLITEIADELVTLEVNITFDGQSQSDVQVARKDEFLTTAVVEYVLAHCDVEGGTLETVQVAAGEFQACHVKSEDGKNNVWIGNVPFGIVKQVSVDESENTITVELKDYKFGAE
jgi:hypothetical protein